jgi:hypothetical protein
MSVNSNSGFILIKSDIFRAVRTSIVDYLIHSENVIGEQKAFASSIQISQDVPDDITPSPAGSLQTGKNHEYRLKEVTERGIWLYPNEFKGALNTKLIQGLLDRKFNVIYFSIGNDTKISTKSMQQAIKFIEAAKEAGVEVYGVTLEDPSFVNSTELKLRQAFGNTIKNTRGLFDAYIIDVEPQIIKGSDPKVYLHMYVTMSNIISKIAEQNHVKYFDTVPSWYHEEMKRVGIINGLDSLSSDGILMLDYDANVSKIIKRYNAIKNEVNKGIVINFKVSPKDDGKYLDSLQIPDLIRSLNNQSISYGIFEAKYAITLLPKLFR